MTARAARPLFVDTGAFIAWFDDDDQHHDRAKAVFQAIQSGDLPYRPLYTSRSVLAETATRLQRSANVGHAGAVEAVNMIRQSSTFNIESLTNAEFVYVCEEFARYDDQQISFVDHTTAVLARERHIDRVFAFDSDFRTLGFTVVPEDTGEP